MISYFTEARKQWLAQHRHEIVGSQLECPSAILTQLKAYILDNASAPLLGSDYPGYFPMEFAAHQSCKSNDNSALKRASLPLDIGNVMEIHHAVLETRVGGVGVAWAPLGRRAGGCLFHHLINLLE